MRAGVGRRRAHTDLQARTAHGKTTALGRGEQRQSDAARAKNEPHEAPHVAKSARLALALSLEREAGERASCTSKAHIRNTPCLQGACTGE